MNIKWINNPQQDKIGNWIGEFAINGREYVEVLFVGWNRKDWTFSYLGVRHPGEARYEEIALIDASNEVNEALDLICGQIRRGEIKG